MARRAALIGQKQHAKFPFGHGGEPTAGRISPVDGWAASERRVGLGWTAVILQRAEHRVSDYRCAADDSAVNETTHQVVAGGRKSARAISEYSPPPAQ